MCSPRFPCPSLLPTYFRQEPSALCLGLDCDNGGEFINAHLIEYCKQRWVTFTRSRPERKNDNCFVEQKNWVVVRKTVGYRRYDTPEQLVLLNKFYSVLRLYTNFFQPTLKLVRKERHGARLRRIYDEAKTLYQRDLASDQDSAETKERLAQLFLTPPSFSAKSIACRWRSSTSPQNRSSQRPHKPPRPSDRLPTA